MSEPGAGSDLMSMRTTAVRDGDSYVLNGSKTFITNGIQADLVVVAAKSTQQPGSRGINLLVVERGMPGFERGRKLDKLGLRAQDTAELYFSDVRVPVNNLLGKGGRGFGYMVENMSQERLHISVLAVAGAEAALTQTLTYCKERTAFGQPIGSFQHNRFTLAEIATEVDIARTYLDRAIHEHNMGRLDSTGAAMVKLWTSELQKRVIDRCLQLHGGYGYMADNPVAKTFIDSRVQTIYGGTTEIMKEIIGRSLGV